MDTFDYVIVGGGSAGSLLAFRLSEAGHSVCVIEAGPPDRNPYILIPAGFIKTLADPAVTWQFQTEPCEGTAGRPIGIPQGRTLGGSSAINGAIYSRGQPADFDGWAQLGNTGWSFADVLPYFRRTERRIGDADEHYRGREGRLPVTTNRLDAPVAEAFIDGAVEQGLPRNADHNGAEQFGVAYSQSVIHKGLRVSAARAFLHPARRRYGVEIRTDALVTRVIVENGRATGVAYRHKGVGAEQIVRAGREVILSAGAFNTPKLMQLSGLGPGAVLRDAGIGLVRDLPGVGENLRDHYNARIVARGVPGMNGINRRVQGWRLGREVLRWMLRRPSVLSISPALVHVFGKSNPVLDNPDFFLVFTPGSYKRGFIGKLDDFPGLSCGSTPLRPESRGTVRIKSAEAAVPPVIQPNYLSAEYDQRIQVAALRCARSLIESAPMRPFVEAENFPGADVQTDDQWLAFARETGGTSFHPAGTCRMGPAGDPDAVVDPNLRVHGIDGLRIVDASVMPTLVSANTYAATMMIAEKAADLILGRPPLSPAR